MGAITRMNTEPAPNTRPGLILVDDDPLIVEALSFALKSDFEVFTTQSRPQTKELLASLTAPPSLALVDLGLPPHPHTPTEGFALITELLGANRHMKILVLSGQNERANIHHALTLGAVDFVPKPCSAELLRARLQHQHMLLEVETAQATAATSPLERLRGNSAPMQTLRASIKQFAASPFPILIAGESGSGKELVAIGLHEASRRADQPLLTVNCAALNAELLDAQLFGHERGAYTGADSARRGFFEEAAQGTLVLDEVGEIPPALQAKLLRVLENGEYYRLGETRARRAACRVIAATNRDLGDATRAGTFRADLFHRLSVLTISVPPLRQRGDDCLELLEHFQQQYASTLGPFSLDEEAQTTLRNYHYPGNVRELRNICIRLGTKYHGQCLGAAQVRAELETQIFQPEYERPTPHLDDLLARIREPGFRLDEEITALEKRYIATALAHCRGNLSKTARLLNVNRTTLYSKITRLGLNTDQE